MTDFFDWLTACDSGLSAERLREHFRLSEEEMRRTVEALAPAFLLGLQRLSAHPGEWASFLRRATPFAIDQDGFGRPGTGSNAMAALMPSFFGTELLVESVARQASMMAGVAPDTIRRIMPDLALMTLRTMQRMTGISLTDPLQSGTEAGGRATAEMLRRSANAVEAFSRPSGHAPASSREPTPTYLEKLFADALGGGFGWFPVPMPSNAPAPPAARSAGTFPFDPFAPWLGAFSSLPDGTEKGWALKPDGPAGSSASSAGGRSMQETYALEMLALFDRFRPRAR